jgi:hypothetical protein
MNGRTRNPVRRSTTTEATDVWRWPLAADSRATRKTSPPTVLGRKFDTNMPASVWENSGGSSEGMWRASSTCPQRTVDRKTATVKARRPPTSQARVDSWWLGNSEARWILGTRKASMAALARTRRPNSSRALCLPPMGPAYASAQPSAPDVHRSVTSAP